MAINRNNLYLHLIERQFNLVEKVTIDALLENWREWKISKKQYKEFRKYSISLLKKVLKINTNKAKSAFDWFYENHGLKIE